MQKSTRYAAKSELVKKLILFVLFRLKDFKFLVAGG